MRSRKARRDLSATGRHESVEPRESHRQIALARWLQAAESAAGRHRKRVIYMGVSVAVALMVIAVALGLRSVSDSRSYENYLLQAQESMAQLDYDGALAALRKAAAIERSKDCLMTMVDCYEMQGNYIKGLELLRSMDTKDPEVAARITALELLRQESIQGQSFTIAGRSYPAGTTSLDLSGQGLDDSVLEEVCQLHALQYLDLSDNQLKDISPLSELRGLVSLDLSGNQVEDLSPLTYLVGLRSLSLDSNPATELSPLCVLPNLSSLSIRGMEADPAQLEALASTLPNCAIHTDQDEGEVKDIIFGGVSFKADVTELDLSGQGIRDISALAECKQLIKLNISGNQISDLSPLMELPQLQWLDASENSLSDLRPLMGIESLSYIDVSHNNISSTTALSMMNGVKELYLDHNPIKDFSGLRKVKSLERLGLGGTGITDESLSYLSGLTKLISLDLGEQPAVTGEGADQLQQKLPSCTITSSGLVYSIDLGGQSVPSNALELDLSNKGIADISALSQLTALERLDLSGNSISNIYVFEYAGKSLKELDLSGNLIEDITPLTYLTGLEVLDLSNNAISSETPFMNLTALKTLYLRGTQLTEQQIYAIEAALPGCEVVVD